MSEVACVFGPAVDQLRSAGLVDEVVAGGKDMVLGGAARSDTSHRVSLGLSRPFFGRYRAFAAGSYSMQSSNISVFHFTQTTVQAGVSALF